MYMRNSPSGPTGRPFLSQTAEHALRAALFLGTRGAGGLVSAREVAEALGMPANYTAKTLRQLTRKGVLRSTRGRLGGFTLGMPASELSVARIIEAVDEPPPRHAACLLGDRLCDAATPCDAHRRWMEVQRRTSELLERTSLADLLGGDPASAHPAPAR
jgi:Rrf2 family protein